MLCRNSKIRTAFTLIELLIVISILTVMTAMLVPQIRTITKERGVREAARIVGAAFAEASQRARSEGSSGIAIIRNPNYYRLSENGLRIYYASNSLFQLKNKLPYVGNEEGDVATIVSVSAHVSGSDVAGQGYSEVVIRIPTPFDTSVTVDRFATIQLGGNSNRLKILSAPTTPTPPTIDITVLFEKYQPIPPVDSTHSFVVHRLPEISSSTEVILPRGYNINLNYSGDPLRLRESAPDDSRTWTIFSEDLGADSVNQQAVFVLLNGTGGVDRVLTNGMDQAGAPGWYRDVIPMSPINLCIAPDDEWHSFEINGTGADLPRGYYKEVTAAGGPDLLNDASILWVSIDHLSGAVGVNENSVPTLIPDPAPTGNALATVQRDRIMQALQITGKKRVALQ